MQKGERMKEKFNLYSLGKRELRKVKAGWLICLCGCAWADCGGSSSSANAEKNSETGLVSKDYTPQDSN